ncbi:hypothetical protein M1D96_16015 [Pseudomonas sp. D1-3]
MESVTPIDLERRSFTALRCVFLSIMAAFNLWLAGALLVPNGLLIYLSVFVRDNSLHSTHETLKALGQTFG